jgi:DNA-binding NtrC family response regulator
MPADALQALTGYHRPGNVHELQNAIAYAVILTPDLPLLPGDAWPAAPAVLTIC